MDLPNPQSQLRIGNADLQYLNGNEEGQGDGDQGTKVYIKAEEDKGSADTSDCNGSVIVQ